MCNSLQCACAICNCDTVLWCQNPIYCTLCTFQAHSKHNTLHSDSLASAPRIRRSTTSPPALITSPSHSDDRHAWWQLGLRWRWKLKKECQVNFLLYQSWRRQPSGTWKTQIPSWLNWAENRKIRQKAKGGDQNTKVEAERSKGLKTISTSPFCFRIQCQSRGWPVGPITIAGR